MFKHYNLLMAKSHRNQPAVRAINRIGEGPLIDVHLQQSVQADGQTTSSLGIDLARAPVPDRRYVADVVSVIHGSHVIKLLFGQEKVSSGLRSLIVIHMAPFAVNAFVFAILGMKNSAVDDALATSHIDAGLLSKITDEPEQTVAMTASVAAAAVSGPEACVDFYQISPFSRMNVVASKKINVDPVVRVDLSTSLLVALVGKLKEISSNFPDEVMHGG